MMTITPEDIPFEPVSLLAYSDGSVQVTTIDSAVAELGRHPGEVRAYAIMGTEIALDREVDE